ncbi:uncharacterized protein LOC131024826 [Salvia miltiorrhiza]|uniref:uncharacterized protein LOC131024826 n=1 Tax=Salvia miltiorrhiza TaxID=226208 RepID=UPI0025AC5C11|nr:uncharacterized protein LOC131024826 [Salvia miltiorrhiza]
MEEASKVRLVRCPKCENLLPELPDFSLYKCGGCGAILKAKKRVIVEDRSSEISEDLKGGGISEENSIAKGTKVDIESADVIEDGAVEKIQKEEGLVSNGTSTSPAELKETQADSDTSRRGKERVRNVESSDDEFRPYPQGLIRNRNRGKSCDFRVDGPEFVDFHDDNVKGMPPMDSSRSRPVMDQWGVKSKGSVHGPARGVPAQVRFDDFVYHDEGQSSYGINSYYEQGERTRYRGHNLDRHDSIESLENGRVELLRKLDELKDRISRSCDMADKPKEQIGIDQRMVSPTSSDPYGRHHAAYAQEGLTTTSQATNRQPLYPDNIVPPYFSRSAGFVPYSDRHGSTVMDSYPQRGYPHEYMHYANTYKPEVLRRPPHQLQSQYIQQPYHEHYPGYYSDANHDRFMLHRHENFFHQPACSCVHCCDNNWHMPPRVDPPGLHNRRSQNEPSNQTFDHLNPILHRQQVNSSGAPNLYPPQSRQSLTLNPNDIDSENDGFNYHRPRKLVVAPKSGRVSHPVGGGAPFITCSNCFELLRLPRKHISMDKNQQKLKCGACSSVILFELGKKGFVASVSTLVGELPTEIDEVSGGTVDNVIYWNDGSSAANMNTCSNDFDDFDHKCLPADKKPNSSMPEKQLNNLSSTSSPSEDEQSPENKSSRKHDSPIPDLPVSPQELPVHSPENVIVSRFDKWNKSKRPGEEMLSLDRTTSKQNSARDGAVATETDVSLTAFSNSNRSQDSTDISREVPKVNKGGESFFAGLIKKSFRDFKKSNQGGEVGGSQVFVNGHLIPDRVVKKAEKLAGPIQPGEYWYDKQAGFWGVVGYPCLGIVMPNIEEFNYPMPKNCAAGNTGVFVNGRELNEKDLDLLSSRGLPITENRSYLIDITGKVVDEQTREELDGLGKLAPTVERAKHGFGMKVPKFIAQLKS